MRRRLHLIRRATARLRGEVSGRALDAYARAGLDAYALHGRIEERRELGDRGDPWLTPEHEQVEALCAWNALVLQTFADDLVAADHERSPATAGYVPPGLGLAVQGLYREGGEWLLRARRAQADTGYRIDLPVPQQLPRLAPSLYAGEAGETALRTTLDTVIARAWSALEVLAARAPAERGSELAGLRRLLGAVTATADYAAALGGERTLPELRGDVAGHRASALADVYVLGQLLAMPLLTSSDRGWQRAVQSTHAGRTSLLPGDAGFDEWCLTCDHERSRRRLDYASQRRVSGLWAADPDPRRTLALHGEIDRAWEAGLVDAVARGSEQIHLVAERCPWPAVWFAARPLSVAGVPLGRLDLFTLLVSAELTARGQPFKRALVVSPRSRPLRTDATPREPGWGLGSPLDQLFEVYDR